LQNDKAENQIVIVGLGNPGERYCQTLHNMGFKVVDELAGKHGWPWKYEKHFQAQVAKGVIAHAAYHLLKPETYMNLSGEAVRSYLTYYQIPAEKILVVVDDADLPLGHLRMRPFGGSGGQRGLENIKKELLTDQFKRMKLGIGRPIQPDISLADFVLTPQSGAVWTHLQPTIAQAASLIERLAILPFDVVMNEANTFRRTEK
jgi:peptidyl-tRNA hydrolase, PTH1 family